MQDEAGEHDELTPEAEARIRAALASAGTDEPMPDEVVARLDAVLAGLVGERHPELVRARGRRGAGRYLLVAASAVVVLAVGVPVVRGITDAGGGSTAGSASDQSAGQSSGRSPSTLDQPTPGSSPNAAQPQAGPAAPPALASATFRADVRRVLPSLAILRATGQRAGTCGGASAAPGAGFTRPVLLDRSPALLEVFPVENGQRLVRAVSCDGTRTLASARIPAP